MNLILMPSGVNARRKEHMTNTDIVVKFLEQKWCHSRRHTIHSDGTSLWSYDWWEMARWVDGVLVIRYGKRFSPSTGKQMGQLIDAVARDCTLTVIAPANPRYANEKAMCASKETPRWHALMNI